MKKLSLALLAGITLTPALAVAQTTVEGESYPDYYKSIDRIVLKDVMSRFFHVSKTGILSFGLEDAAKTAGHVCPAITGAFLMTQAGVEALAQSYRDEPSKHAVTSYDPVDNVMYRGGIKITMSGEGHKGGAPDAMANVMSMITGAKDDSGFKNGPDFPFANRQNLLTHDPKLSFSTKSTIEAIFTSMTAEYKDKDGKPASLKDCEGTWHKCVETTKCDRSVKVSYHFASPDIIGTDDSLPWDRKIKNIIDHKNLAISVERVDNPPQLCGK